MLQAILKKIGIKSKNDRIVEGYQALVDRINESREKFEAMNDDELRGMTDAFRKRIVENAVERAKARLASDDRGLRKKLGDIFEEEQGGDFLAVSVKKYQNPVLSRFLGTLEQEVHAKALDLKELSQFEEFDSELLKEGIEEYLRETLHEEMENSMDDILPEAFAVVREAAWRTLGDRAYEFMIYLNGLDDPAHEREKRIIPHDEADAFEQELQNAGSVYTRYRYMGLYDVQVMGSIALHQGKISEMKTGEGKTITATLPVYLNALTGRGVHVITVNDYLAKRDSEWMGKIYTFLGLTVGVIQNGMRSAERQAAYGSDITYGTNNEFGFDYLRDNLADSPEDRVQRELNYAIVDEVDSILIDEARTPLIISGQVAHDSNKFVEFRSPVRGLVSKQQTILNELFRKLKEYSESDDPEAYEKYELLLKLERGNPKDERLLDYIAENKQAKKKMLQTENDYMRDKRVHELSDGLLFAISEREHNVELTDEGRQQLSYNEPELFLLPDLDEEFSKIDGDDELSDYEKTKRKQELTKIYDERHEKIHNIHQLIKAYNLFKRDVDYVVNNGEVLIVDEFTGRMMPGRRYSDGLHQALEAKEGLQIAKASQTVATVTLQNYFRLYRKLAGMTGTAETEAQEFMDIYKLEVVIIPTNEPLNRKDLPDVIYKTEKAKFRAVAREIAECYIKGQPALVGTVTIKVSEQLSDMLKKDLKKALPPEQFEQLRQVNEERGQKNRNIIPHEVLNAKYHEKEAEIVAGAGQFGTVTIATNMAGRGTDIVLGEGVKERGGLFIVGTERHESRRIDNQLRGRAGRQGDPGASKFFLSLEDDLMRIFGSDRIANIMGRLGIEEDEPIEHSMITGTIERAQKKVEGVNYEIRKNLLKYDDVNNKQREVIYTRRDHVTFSDNLERDFLYMAEDVLHDMIETYAEAQYPEDWDLEGLKGELLDRYGVYQSFEGVEIESLNQEDLLEMLKKSVEHAFMEKKAAIEGIPDEPFQAFFGRIREGDTKMNVFLRGFMLRAIDRNWMDNLQALDSLKEGIHFQGYAQKDPLVEYKREGYGIFAEMIERVNRESVEGIMKFTVRPRQEQRQALIVSASERTQESHGLAMRRGQQMQQSPDEYATNTSESNVAYRPVVRDQPKVGRNDPCPCGSGKKYKKCCGR